MVNVEAYSLVKIPQMYLDMGHDGLFFGIVQERAVSRILDMFEMKARILLMINLDCSMHPPPDGASSCRSTRE